MFNKKDFLSKIKKNKIRVLIISIIVICTVYFAAEKAIDSYIFNNNSDIVSADSGFDEEVGDGENSAVNGTERYEKNWFERLFGGDDEDVMDVVEGIEEVKDNENGQLRDDETDLVLEEVTDGSEAR